MAGDSETEPRDFLTVACQLGVLPDAAARSLADEATLLDLAPEHLALKKGLLSATQVDMVQTLLHPGDMVPGYEVLGILGQGGMGVVYRARQMALQRIVALKTVLLSQMTLPTAVARFEQEAVAVARLRHPNIIAAYDFGRHQGRLYLVLELVVGEDLNELITRRGRLDEAVAWGLARQVAAGLAHAAQEGIVHRDIKPANLLLVEPPAGYSLPAGVPMVKIADFGLAFLTEGDESNTRLTAANTTLGSPHYMAPEQLSESQVDFRADIYALGVTVYHMLTGGPPFSGPLTQILAQKLRGEIPDIRTRRPDVSAATSQLIGHMTRLDPHARPANYRDLLQRIEQVLSPAPPPTRSASYALPKMPAPPSDMDAATAETRVYSSPEIAAASTRTSRRAWLVTAAITTAIGLVGFFISQWRPHPPPNSAPTLIPSGGREYLFKGSLKDWLSASGQWGDAVDDDGAPVLAGTGGVVRRELIRVRDNQRQPLANYQVSLGICLHDATAVEVQFGVLAATQLDSPRSVLRITKGGQVWLALRANDAAQIPPVASSRTWKVDPNRYHAVQIERWETTWRVLFDEQLVGTLPIAPQPQRPEIRFAAEAGPAWFSDIEVEELVPAAEVQ